jgi:uncharacterized protein YqeY
MEVPQIDSAAQFTDASRSDLAEKERREADILSAFLPPLLAESEIDRILLDILAEHKFSDVRGKTLGIIFKAFYAMVDKSSVDTALVKRRAEVLLKVN